jgi:hypothetical protein
MNTCGTIEQAHRDYGTHPNPTTVEVGEFAKLVGVDSIKDWVKRCAKHVDLFKADRYGRGYVYEYNDKCIRLPKAIEYLSKLEGKDIAYLHYKGEW